MGVSRIDKLIVDPAGANNMTGVATVLSTPVRMDSLQQLSLELNYTGTPTGVLTWEDSDTYDPVLNPNAVFFTLATTAALTNPAGAAGSQMVAVTKRGKWGRVRYVNSASTGSLSVRAFGTGVV